MTHNFYITKFRYEDWVKSKSADRRASATPMYNFDRRGSTVSTAGFFKFLKWAAIAYSQKGRLELTRGRAVKAYS